MTVILWMWAHIFKGDIFIGAVVSEDVVQDTSNALVFFPRICGHLSKFSVL